MACSCSAAGERPGDSPSTLISSFWTIPAHGPVLKTEGGRHPKRLWQLREYALRRAGLHPCHRLQRHNARKHAHANPEHRRQLGLLTLSDSDHACALAAALGVSPESRAYYRTASGGALTPMNTARRPRLPPSSRTASALPVWRAAQNVGPRRQPSPISSGDLVTRQLQRPGRTDLARVAGTPGSSLVLPWFCQGRVDLFPLTRLWSTASSGNPDVTFPRRSSSTSRFFPAPPAGAVALAAARSAAPPDDDEPLLATLQEQCSISLDWHRSFGLQLRGGRRRPTTTPRPAAASPPAASAGPFVRRPRCWRGRLLWSAWLPRRQPPGHRVVPAARSAPSPRASLQFPGIPTAGWPVAVQEPLPTTPPNDSSSIHAAVTSASRHGGLPAPGGGGRCPRSSDALPHHGPSLRPPGPLGRGSCRRDAARALRAGQAGLQSTAPGASWSETP